MQNSPMSLGKDPVESVRICDDLWYLGSESVGCYVLRTSMGLVLFDATNDVDADKNILQPGLEKIGLQDEKVLAILITHGYFDHYLGAAKIHQRTGCEVAMSEKDAAFMMFSQENLDSEGRVQGGFYPHITRLLHDDETLLFGGHDVHVINGNGHTPGCLNFSFTVHEKGKAHRAVIMGGLAVFGPGFYPGKEYPYSREWAVEQALNFATSCEHLWQYCERYGCDIYLNSHPGRCNLFEKAERNKDARCNEFIDGLIGVKRYIKERFDCCMKAASRYSSFYDEENGHESN